MRNLSDTLLARYLAGECTSDETSEVDAWVAEAPAHRARLEQLRAIWDARRAGPTWDVQGIWTNVRQTVRASRARPMAFGRDPLRERGPRWLALKVVAAAAAVVIAGAAVVFLDGKAKAARIASAPEPVREYATARGQRATLQLPDGTRLVLAPASRLRIPDTFGRGVREVVLEGEALFDVVHDAARPFRVRAKDAVAEDIGTRFDVRAYPEDSVVAVAVAEGAVALGRAGPRSPASDTAAAATAQGVVLAAGELGTLGPAGEVTMTRGAPVADHLAWAEGRLVFADAPLHEAIARLGRWYDVDVRLASAELGARRLTASFTRESAPEAMRFVAAVLGLALSQTGRRYTLRAQ